MNDPNNDAPAPEALATRPPEPAPTLATFGASQAALDSVLSWLQKTPHDLVTAARASGCRPADALLWYMAGQLPDCPVAELVAFAAEIARRRAALAADNYERTIKAAESGDLRAIERLDALAAASQLEGYPGRGVAEELDAACRSSMNTDAARVLAEHDALPARSL